MFDMNIVEALTDIVLAASEACTVLNSPCASQKERALAASKLRQTLKPLLPNCIPEGMGLCNECGMLHLEADLRPDIDGLKFCPECFGEEEAEG